MGKNNVVKRDSDAKTLRLDKQEAEQADTTAKAKRVILIDESGNPINDSNPLKVDTELTLDGVTIDNVKVFATDISDGSTLSYALVDSAGLQQIDIKDFDDAVNPIRKDMEGGGKISVGTSAVEVTFTGTPTNSIIIRADRNNTGLLFIGESNVTSAGANSLTYLEAGDSVTIDYDDSDNAVYVVASVASQNFYKGALL